MGENEKKFTSEELVKYIQITINNGGPYALMEELKIANRDEIISKIKLAIKESEQKKEHQPQYVDGLMENSENMQNNALTRGNNSFMEASIYAEEHIPAVQEDLIEHQTLGNVPKAKVLEPERNAPNPWGDSEVVSPGHLKL